MPDEKKPDIDPYLFKPVHMQDFKSLVKAIPKRIIGLISKAVGVTAIQTYKSSLHEASLNRILTEEFVSLSEIWVYSSRVLEALETKSFPQATIHHTESCYPNPEKWKKLTQFYPGEEFD